jgi:hypothetical protein
MMDFLLVDEYLLLLIGGIREAQKLTVPSYGPEHRGQQSNNQNHKKPRTVNIETLNIKQRQLN